MTTKLLLMKLPHILSRFWFCMFAAVIFFTSISFSQQKTVAIPLADGFDYPVGKPDAKGYYIARGLRLRGPIHFGEDWNGLGGGDTDLNDPIYATADGIVMFSYDVRVGWGQMVIIRHAYREPSTGQVKFCDSLYGHLQSRTVKNGDMVKRGQLIGTMGGNRGMYPVHLHFEMRHNLNIGMQRESVPKSMEHWIDPRQFINSHRKLAVERGKQQAPIGTYQDYRGCKGL